MSRSRPRVVDFLHLMYKSGPAVIHSNVMMSVVALSSSVMQQMVGVVMCSRKKRRTNVFVRTNRKYEIRASMNG